MEPIDVLSGVEYFIQENLKDYFDISALKNNIGTLTIIPLFFFSSFALGSSFPFCRSEKKEAYAV